MKRKSIYKYAAEAGVPVGFYLTAMSACVLMSIHANITLTFLMLLMVGFPFILGFILRNIGNAEPAYKRFSSLWLAGTYSVIFGTLICMVLTGAYITFVEPGFVHSYCINMIETVEASPMADQYADTIEVFRNALDAHLLPSGMDFVTTMGWFTAFTGAILSLLISLVLTKLNSKVRNTPRLS